MDNSELFERIKDFNQAQINIEFQVACQNGNLNIVKYLLTSKLLKYNAEIEFENNYGLRFACNYGHLKLIKYLLTSSDLKEHADIHDEVYDSSPIINACYYGHLELTKYLLTSSELKEHSDISAGDYSAVRLALENKQYDILKYLIFDYKLKLDDSIKEYLDKKPDYQFENFIKIRELNNTLEKELSYDKINNKIMKV